MNVLKAEGLSSGLALLQQLARDGELEVLVLCDLRLPFDSGTELLQMVKADDQLARYPFCFLTALDIAVASSLVASREVSGYFQKTMDFNELVELMRAIVGYWASSKWPATLPVTAER